MGEDMAAIKSLFTLEGDTITSEMVQAELAKGHAKIGQAKMAGRSGGRTTQERSRYGRMGYLSDGFTMTPPKPLKNNDGPQANAKANYNNNYINRKRANPRPCPAIAGLRVRLLAPKGRRWWIGAGLHNLPNLKALFFRSMKRPAECASLSNSRGG
jgi:hypothetical protein